MKIRYKITLWITGAGVLASLVFSVIVFWEMAEQPYKLVDKELEIMAGSIIRLVKTTAMQPKYAAQKDMLFDTSSYWIKIYDPHMNILYQSKLTRFTDLPFKNTNQPYIVERIIPRERIDLNQDRKNEVAFRIKIFDTSLADQPCKVLIGMPVEELEEEIVDLIQGIAAGLGTTTLLLILLSYYIAGRILTPINTINRLTRDIGERSLDQRIPLGSSKDELYELSNSLNRMFDRLQYSFAMQKQFIADASHELKSPITLLSLFLEDSTQRQDLPESFKLRLFKQIEIVRRMGRLVKNLLELSALKIKNRMDVQALDLFELAQSVRQDYFEVLEARHITIAIHIPEGLRIMGSRDSLQRVLINLVDNAIKYNVDCGKIEITAEVKNGTVHLSVFNTGKGIPEKEIDLVFEQFYRVEKSRSSQHGGSGLGLTIVKQIIELHQGNITIESEPGAWTRVNIHLPHQAISPSIK